MFSLGAPDISDLFSLLSFIQRKQTTSTRSKYKTNSGRLDSDLELGDYSLELYCLLRSYKLVLSFKGRGSNPVTFTGSNREIKKLDINYSFILWCCLLCELPGLL